MSVAAFPDDRRQILLADGTLRLAAPLAARQDPRQCKLYEDWVARLGADRMRGFLLDLRDQLATLADLAVEGERADLHKLAHDVASTAGMLGFLEVTRRCRAVLEADVDEAETRLALGVALEAAIDRLDLHLADERRDAA